MRFKDARTKLAQFEGAVKQASVQSKEYDAELAKAEKALKEVEQELALLRGDPVALRKANEEDLVAVTSKMRAAIALAEDERSRRETCVVCLYARRMTMLEPCQHLCLCPDCSRRVSVCPVCRKAILDRVQILL